MKKPIVETVITDLDNTLYDWFHFWFHSFGAMLDRLVADSGVPREVLIREIQEIHEKHGTVEYAFLIEEIPSLRRRHPGEDLVKVYDESIHAFRSARKRHLQLYPGVLETLQHLKSEGVLLVGYTESLGFYSSRRVRMLGLDGLLDALYSPADHALPRGLQPDQIRRYPPQFYALEHTRHSYTPPGELKPNPAVLLDILGEVGAAAETSIYIGDSLVKDIQMAQDARVLDVHARYGTAHTREEYELLRAVTHWTPEQVEREKAVSRRDVRPTCTLEESFGEIRDLFELRAFRQAPRRVSAGL